MSTNYYAVGPFPGGDAAETRDGLHIGQSAAGWRFLFHSHPDLGIVTYDAWTEFLRRPDVTIRAESGYDLTVEEMDAAMTANRDQRGWPLKARAAGHRLPDGYHLDGRHTFCARDFC
ncbi:hypothetical protein ACFXI0_07885 [Kitasatospora indigofera]|uniref:hypothetical protein n=1 Tax=Kitasatospora indigofera TaxID=67307 RepID=UPI0036A152B3